MSSALRNSLILLTVLLGSLTPTAEQQAPDPRVADLIQSGKLRVGIFPPQYVKARIDGGTASKHELTLCRAAGLHRG